MSSAERLEDLKKSLGQRLQQLVTSLRSFQAAKAAKTPELINESLRMWEQYQRCLLADKNDEDTYIPLIGGALGTYNGLYRTIDKFDDELLQMSSNLLDLSTDIIELTREHALAETAVCLRESIEFLETTVDGLQHRLNRIELILRQINPRYTMQETGLELFKNALEVPEDKELGLAKIEQMLKSPWDFSQQNNNLGE